MATYQLADTFHAGDAWIIERVVPGEPPYRLHFKGTRKAAEAEVAGLNALAARPRDADTD